MSNTVVLLSDEHNPIYSEPYGHEVVSTPNMQALANRGVIFENAYCPSPLCMPSRSAFMAGQRTHQLQTYSNCNLDVDPSPQSLGTHLKKQQVHSVYIGKTDVYAPGKALGFSEMLLPGDRELPGDTNHRRNPMSIRTGSKQRANGYGPNADAVRKDLTCIDEAIRWLKHTSPSLNVPWTLIVNIESPHFPHFSPQEFWEMYTELETSPQFGSEYESAQHPYAKAIKQHFETEAFTEAQIAGLRRGYLACISFVDHQLGRLSKALAAMNISESTNLIYASDHGEMLGKFGMWWKCSLYEDAVRIPIICAGPDFNKGERIKTPVDLHDLQACLFAANQVTQPPAYLGTPLQNIPIDDRERVVFSEYHGHGAPGSSYMIRQGAWKYIYYTSAEKQLFNLENDPNELCNLAASQPDIVLALDQELRKICSPEIENERAEEFIESQLQHIQEKNY